MMGAANLWRKLHLWPRLVIAVTVVFVVLFGVFSLLALRAVDESTDQILSGRLVIAHMAASELDRVLQRAVGQLETSRSLARFEPNASSQENESPLLTQAHRGLGRLSLGIYFLDAQGRLVVAEPSRTARIGRTLSTTPYVRRVLATRRLTISAPFRTRSGKPAVAVAMPILNPDGRLRSVLVEILDVSSVEVTGPLQEATRLGRTGHGELVGPGGIVIASTEAGDALHAGEHLPFYRQMLRTPDVVVESVVYTPWNQTPSAGNGAHHVMAWAPLRVAPWGVAVGGTDRETFAPVRRLRWTLLLAGAGTLAALWLLILVGARLLVRPVQTLTQAARQMASGDLEDPVRVREGGEIGVLAESLEAMRMQLAKSLVTVRRWGESLEMKVDERTAELRVRNRQLAAVTAVATAANSAHTLPQLLDGCLAAIVEHTRADGVAVRLVDEATGDLSPARAQGSYQSVACRPQPNAANACPCELVAAGEQPLHLGQANERSLRLRCATQSDALAVLPLRAHERVLGVLVLTAAHGEPLEQGERKALAAIADQLANALESAQLLEQLGQIQAQREIQRMRADLIAAVSHELRTPLGFIKSYATTLLRGAATMDTETRYQFLGIIDEESGRLEQMIEELLDASRLQTGQFPIDPTSVELRALVNRVATKVRPALEESDHELIVRVPAEDVHAFVDPLRLEQVLDNLLDNATMYSDRGTVIEVGLVGEDDRAILTVRDHGEGIPSAEHEAIFDPFYRGTNSRQRGTRGVGLGLAICRGIVMAQGGEIWVDSEPGRGARFVISLPISRTATPTSAVPPRQGRQDARASSSGSVEGRESF
jgi:signal transduction histidine kinase/HAMP domain-containing protein